MGFSSRGKSPTPFQNQDQLKILLSTVLSHYLVQYLLLHRSVKKKEQCFQLSKEKKSILPTSSLELFQQPINTLRTTIMKDLSFFSSLKTPLEKGDSTCFTPLQDSHLHCSARVTLFTPFFAFFFPNVSVFLISCN